MGKEIREKTFSLLLAQRRLEHLDQLPVLVGFDHDVAAPEEAARDVDLREGRPGLFEFFRVFFKASREREKRGGECQNSQKKK